MPKEPANRQLAARVDQGIPLRDSRMSRRWPKHINRERYEGRSRGLRNRRQICYRVAIVQAMLHTPVFINFLNNNIRPCVIPDNCVLCQMIALILSYYKDEREALHDRWAAFNLAVDQWSQANELRLHNGRQHDALEFLEHLVMNYGAPALSDNHKFMTRYLATMFEVKTKEVRSSTSCGCTFTALSSSTCLRASPPVENTDLPTLLDQFLRSANSGTCPNHPESVLQSSTTIHSRPKIMVVQINFATPRYRRPRRVTLPRQLDLSSYTPKGSVLRYELQGVIQHRCMDESPLENGEKCHQPLPEAYQNCGHYDAHVFNAQDEWALCDDMDVNGPIAEIEVRFEQPQAYAVWYTKICG